MANARREVDLIVKAKDDAVRVLDAITDAINSMVDAQADLTANAKKTSTGIGGLVSAVADLGKALKGGNSADKLADDLNKANRAVEALRSGLEQAQGDLTDYSKRATEAATETDRLKAALAGAEKQLTDQAADLGKATTAQAKYADGLKKADAEIKKLTRSIPNLTRDIFDQQAKVTETAAKYEALGQKIAAAEKPSATLQERFANLGTRLEKQTATLAEYRDRLESAVAEMEQASAAAAEFGAKIEASAAGIKTQEAAIAATSQQIADYKSNIKEAAATQRELEQSATKAGAAVKRQEGQLKGAEQGLETLGAATDKVSANMAQLAAAARGPLAQAVAAQRGVVSQISQEYQKIRTELAQVNAAMRGAGLSASGEMVAAYNRLRQSLNEVEAEFGQQRSAYKEMQAAVQGLTGDTDQLIAVTTRFGQTTSQAAAALGRVRAESAQAAGTMSRLSQSTGQAVVNEERLARATGQTAAAMGQAAQRSSALANAYRQIYGESRQALSYTQRLRGEVLSLVSAYGGIFGVITMLQRVVEATQKVERAQIRLTALYSGDTAKAGAEFEFISRTADRLGIDIGELADEYTKFSAATKGTVLAGQKTRDVFLRVAEAGRVNGLSMADMSGIFKALTQIASKGKVQLEELTGQLGDRLPGALQIMADGLGITTEELLELTKKGEVSSSALANFADNLAERYGEALPAALKTTSAEIGRFENALTRALLAFGQGGFIDGFNSLLRSLTATLRDADFLAFAQNVSAAFGLLAKTIGVLVENFKVLIAIVGTFVGIRLLPAITSLGLAFTNFGRAMNQAQIQAAIFRRESAALGATVGTTAGRVSALSVAAQGLRGGLAGLAVGAVVGLLTQWLTSAGEVNEAMTEHQRIMGLVKGAYDQNQQSVEAWRKSLAELSTQELTNNLQRVKSAAETARINALSGFEEGAATDMGDPAVRAINQSMVDLTNAVFDGKKSLEEYRNELDALQQAAAKLGPNGSGLADAIQGAHDLSEETFNAAKAVKEAADALDVKSSKAEVAEAAMKRLTGATDASGRSVESMAAGSKTFNSALDEMKSLIPEVNKGLDVMQQKANLDAAFQSAVRAAQTISELNGAIKQYNETASALFANAAGADLKGITDGVEAAATILRAREGFIPYAKMDVNALRTGFGSDTTTDENNVVRKVTESTRVTVADANRDLYRRIGEFNNVIVGQIGDKFGQFSAAQQGVLTSIAYNYGELPQSLANVINANGTPEEIAAAIRELQTDNKGINRDRRLYEAAAFESGTDVDAETKAYLNTQKELTKEKEKQAEAAKKFHDEQLQSNEALAQENALSKEDLVTRETAKAIREAENKAKEAGTTLTEQERAAIIENTRLKYQEQAAQDAVNASKKTAEEAESKFNAIAQQRAALLKQADALRAQGNTAGANAAVQQANALKTSMDQAAAAAIAMWQKIGGPEAQAAIEKIRQANLESQNLKTTGNQVSQMWTAVGESLMNNLSTAIDEFAQAVANGENAWKALGRALQKAAAQFLIDIGKMIIKQMLFNALSGIFPGLTNPLGAGVAHSGTGSGTLASNPSNRTRNVDPRVFAMAPRFHRGYQSGLGSNEVATILDKTESVQTKDSPFHPQNQARTMAAAAAAGAGGGKQDIKVLNLIDSAAILEEALNSPAGTKVFINKMRKEKASVKEVMK